MSVLSVGYLSNIHQFRLSEKYFTINVFQLLRRKIDFNKILNELHAFYQHIFEKTRLTGI